TDGTSSVGQHALNSNGAPFEAAAHGAEKFLRFVVRDTGIGISPDKLEKVFSSFTQADSTTTRKYGGSRLRLNIVKRLVELMRARPEAASCPGEGSTFSATIPFDIESAGADETQTDSTPSLAGMRVLVAEEAAASRSVLAELLARSGAEVTEAADG